MPEKQEKRVRKANICMGHGSLQPGRRAVTSSELSLHRAETSLRFTSPLFGLEPHMFSLSYQTNPPVNMSLLTPFPSSSLNLILTSIFLFTSHLALAQNCYYPNGAVAEGMAACLLSGGACCPYQWECLSSGLCYLENAGYYGRYTCTDPTWQSESCPKICTEGESYQSKLLEGIIFETGKLKRSGKTV